MGSRSIEGFVVHRLNPKVTFFIPLTDIDMPRRCCQKQPLIYANLLVVQRVAKHATSPARGLVSLVKERKIYRRQPCSAFCYDFGRLVCREDDLDVVCLTFQELAHKLRVGINFEANIGLIYIDAVVL